MYRLLYIYLVYLVRLLYITCKLCSEYLYRVCHVMLCYSILCLLCYAMVGCCVVPCPKNFSAQSDPVSFCASDNKILDLTDVLLALCAIVLENSLGPCQLRSEERR